MATLPQHHIPASPSEQLRQDGYVILRGVLNSAEISSLNSELGERFTHMPFCDGDFYGRRTKRFGKLLSRSKHGERLLLDDRVLTIVRDILEQYCDKIILNLTQAIEIHPGALQQAPHRDEDMWGGTKGDIEYLVNVMWAVSPFTARNGGTVLHPKGDEENPFSVELDPGDVLIFLGSTLHSGGANETEQVRRGIVMSYCLGWLRSYENQFLCYPPDIAKNFNPEVLDLIGYSQHRPNLGNVDGCCPSQLLVGNLPEHAAPKDHLPPEQASALKEFVRKQLLNSS